MRHNLNDILPVTFGKSREHVFATLLGTDAQV